MGGGAHGDYDIEGIGNDFIADTMDMSLVDQVVKITDAEAFDAGGPLRRVVLRGGAGRGQEARARGAPGAVRDRPARPRRPVFQQAPV